MAIRDDSADEGREAKDMKAIKAYKP